MKPKWVFPVLLVLLVVVIGGVVVSKISSFDPFASIADLFRPASTIDHGPIIIDAVRNESFLATVTWIMANDAHLEEKWGALNACHETLDYLAYYQISAGIDLKKFQASDVSTTPSEDSSMPKIVISLPVAEIMEPPTLLLKDSRILHQENLIIDLCGGSRIATMTIKAQEEIGNKIRTAALEKGILTMAQERAAVEIKDTLFKLGYQDIEINVREGTQESQ